MRLLLGSRTRLAIAVLLLFCANSHSQIVGRPAVNEVIAAAAEQRKAYINEFKDLMSRETKTFEIFGKNGEIKKKRSIVSTFIVYQLSKDDRSIAEYRNIISVDGKQLDADKRAQEFFEEIARVDSSRKELEKLDKEGSRFDEEISLSLFTLYQSVSLADNLRPHFEFVHETTEKQGGRDVLVVSYKQIKDSPYILTDEKNAPSDGKLTMIYDVDAGDEVKGRLSGKLWIDAQTYQVWKELRSFTIQPNGFSGPAVFSENTFEYQPSLFGILTPKKIVYTQFRIDKKAANARKEASVTYDYEPFTKPDVEVRSGEVSK